MSSTLIVVAGAVLAAITTLAVVFQKHPELRKTIIFFGSSVGVATAVIGSIFTFFEFRESTDQHRQAVRLQRQEIAFDYLERFHAIPDKAELRAAMDGLSGKSPKEVQQFFRTNREDGTRVAAMLSYLEEAAVAARQHYADEPTLCAFLEDVVVRYYTTLEGWVVFYREASKNPRYLENLEWLATRWEKGCPPLDGDGVETLSQIRSGASQ